MGIIGSVMRTLPLLGGNIKCICQVIQGTQCAASGEFMMRIVA